MLLGAVVADGYAEGVTVARESDNPLSPGDILIDAPLGVSVEFSIWPKICVQRPENGTWHLMSRELESVETWVRTIALPTIIAGRTSVDPLPPGADTLHGYDSILDAAHSADARTASQRIRSEIEVQMLRSSAPNLLTLFPGPPSIDLPAAERWVASLSDSALLDRMSRLAIGSSNEVIDGNLPFFCRMIEEALVHRPED